MNLVTPVTYRLYSPAETALAQFLSDNAEALVTAAALLGAQPAVRRTARLLEDIVDAQRLTRALRHELIELHRLLALDRVGDPESIEAACFAEIDPASPAVEDICELTDGLRSHLCAIAESNGKEDIWAQIFAAA